MLGNVVLTVFLFVLTYLYDICFRCAPECISYLRFTSASDVWAYGVTLWEMFSYGFQPWAALTGQQILEAIDEPNFQVNQFINCKLLILLL